MPCIADEYMITCSNCYYPIVLRNNSKDYGLKLFVANSIDLDGPFTIHDQGLFDTIKQNYTQHAERILCAENAGMRN